MKRRILLVDDEVAVLLTLKAVLEISGYDVETAASAREGNHRLRTQEFDMIITDMRMESDASGAEVIQAAREASYHPAVALLTAFPLAEEDWQEMGADKMLVKPMQTRVLLQQIEKLLASHLAKLGKASNGAAANGNGAARAPRAARTDGKLALVASAKPKKSASKKVIPARQAKGARPIAKRA
ncbi:MAG TPA: response regulator [Acidobacteriaceae bacterium]|nr:response regulator [Acidobacteriaceae bacterium]